MSRDAAHFGSASSAGTKLGPTRSGNIRLRADLVVDDSDCDSVYLSQLLDQHLLRDHWDRLFQF
jgi:hypothetical protein